MFRFRPYCAGLFGALLAACSHPPSRSAAGPPGELDDRPPVNTEWTLVMESSAGSRDQACQAAYRYIAGDAECASIACAHALRLAHGWTVHCRGVASGSHAAEVERLSIIYESRAKQPPDTCVERAERWVEQGCGRGGACQPEALAWSSRCAKTTGSPFLVFLLEKEIERSLRPEGRPLTVRRPSCPDLAADLRQAATCDARSACEEALPKLEHYRRSCRAGKLTPIGLGEGLAELAILEGAGRAPASLPVSVEPRELGPEQSKVALVGGRVVVLRVCGKRVVDLDQYLQERRRCAGGEVLVIGLFTGHGERVLRLGTFEHPSDTAFLRRLPSWVMAGEREKRDEVELAALTRALDAIVKRKAEQEGIRDLARALGEVGQRLRESEPVTKLLEDRDAALQSMFADLGRRKRTTSLGGLSAPARYAFGARSLALPLSDLDAEGVVSVGAASPVAGLELGPALPKSVAAYRAELGRLGKTRLDSQDEQALAAEVGARTEDCKAALGVAAEVERALLDCAYGDKSCDTERRQTLGRELDDALAKAENARILAAVGLAYLPRAVRENARQAAFAEGACSR